jgi:two-component system, OmpR family, phosphate regulon response regulator OmpR
VDNAPHILVVDDDARLRKLLQNFLAGHGYRVSVAASALAARQMMQGLAFDACILDVMMPGESGLSFVQGLRNKQAEIPVLMISALAESADRISGLSSGSDDYLPKPFEPEELLLRLRNLLRRANLSSVSVDAVRFGVFEFDLKLGELRSGNETLRLTSAEKDILRILAKAKGETVSRLGLTLDAADIATRKVDVQINRLRQKIEVDPANPRFLQTVRGAGYVLHLERGA